MTWEPGYREVPSFDDPPEYVPDEDWDDDTPLTDAEQDEAEARWETYYQPTEGDRGGPDA